jgi:hypothetical protein
MSLDPKILVYLQEKEGASGDAETLWLCNSSWEWFDKCAFRAKSIYGALLKTSLFLKEKNFPCELNHKRTLFTQEGYYKANLSWPEIVEDIEAQIADFYTYYYTRLDQIEVY